MGPPIMLACEVIIILLPMCPWPIITPLWDTMLLGPPGPIMLGDMPMPGPGAIPGPMPGPGPMEVLGMPGLGPIPGLGPMPGEGPMPGLGPMPGEGPMPVTGEGPMQVTGVDCEQGGAAWELWDTEGAWVWEQGTPVEVGGPPEQAGWEVGCAPSA